MAKPALLSSKQRLAAQLWRLADLERANSSRRSFASGAYRNAVWALDHLSPDLQEDAASARAVPGIGRTVADMISEFRDTGQLTRLQRLEQSLPLGAAQLSRLPCMTPTRLRRLKQDLGVEEAGDFLAAINDGTAGEIRGVGKATLAIWKDRLLARLPEGMPIYEAERLAAKLRAHFASHLPHVEFEVVGGVRRFDEWIGQIELLAGNDRGIEQFLAASAVVSDLKVGRDKLTLATLAGEVTVHLGKAREQGTSLVLHTGPAEHLAALKLAGEKYGHQRWWAAPTEADFYDQVGSDVVPPPARSGEFPLTGPLVTREHLRGDFHLHSDWSPDGRQSLQALADGARGMGWDYFAITDHGHELRFGGLTAPQIRQQAEVLDQLKVDNPDLVILHGAELNISRDGELDFDDGVLAGLDFRLASIHSHFGLSQSQQTERLIKVIANPLVHAIGHPTGRRIGVRPPLNLDLGAVFEAASFYETALEVNGHLDRLDLSAPHARLAAQWGVAFLANSDAHRASELANVSNAVKVLQKAGVGPRQVVNAWDLSYLLEWLVKRPRGQRLLPPAAG